jgi:hypothetical protein
VAEDFTAHACLARLSIREDAPGSGENGGTESVANEGNVSTANVRPTTRATHPDNALDDALLSRVVPKLNANVTLRALIDLLKTSDIAFGLEKLGDFHLDARTGNVDAGVASLSAVANSRKHI